MTLEQFNPLYARFKKASSWIESEYRKRGWKKGTRSYDPQFEQDLKEFDELVVEPMDSAWQTLSQEDKDKLVL